MGFLDREGAVLAGAPDEIPEFVRAAAATDDEPLSASREPRLGWDPWQA